MAAGKVLEATDAGKVPTHTSCGWQTVGVLWHLPHGCPHLRQLTAPLASAASATSTPGLSPASASSQGGCWPLTTEKGKLLKKKEVRPQGGGASLAFEWTERPKRPG